MKGLYNIVIQQLSSLLLYALYLPVCVGGGEQDSVIVVGWWFTHSRSSATVSLVTGTNLTEMVTVSDGIRTMVTFNGVQREAAGGKVVCVQSFLLVLSLNQQQNHNCMKFSTRSVEGV